MKYLYIILTLFFFIFLQGTVTAQYKGGEGGGAIIITEDDYIAVDLPVVLVYFKGTLDEGQVILSWETATEINNDFFEIEYSNDRRSWKTINTVDGLGNSDVSIRYEYIDKYRNATSYYRLKQVDFDGQFEYSAVIRVVGEGSTTSTLMAFPNPFKERVTLTADEFEMKSLRIFNSLGKEIKITPEAVSMRHLDVSNLQSGFYYFKTRKTTMKLIKE